MAQYLPRGMVVILYASAHEDVIAEGGGERCSAWQSGKYLLTFLTTDRLEQVLPLQGGILRLKHPTERRPNLPQEGAWTFWPRFVWEMIRKQAILAHTITLLLVWVLAIRRDVRARSYKDLALTPEDDDNEALDLITKTTGGSRSFEEDCSIDRRGYRLVTLGLSGRVWQPRLTRDFSEVAPHRTAGLPSEALRDRLQVLIFIRQDKDAFDAILNHHGDRRGNMGERAKHNLMPPLHQRGSIPTGNIGVRQNCDLHFRSLPAIENG